MIGKKRAKALGTARLVACVDVVVEKALALAQMVPGAIATDDWRAVLDDSKVDVVIVSTTNNMLAEVTLAAVQAGKHVLVEKPGARRSRDIKVLMEAAQRFGRQVRVGFNHRYHPSLRKAHELLEAGALGEMMLVRGRYGHGGRLGYEKEWRADPALSGGGELIDQGAHLIDLSRWFLGDFSEATGFAHTYFWKMPVEDNAFLILKTPQQRVAHLHVSWTEWKNLFSLEIYGRTAKLHVEGLGGSYGIERLSCYKMSPQMGPPETTIWEYPMDDNSWHTEFEEFLEDIKLARTPSANLNDALAVLSIVEKIYTESGYDYHP
jgi:predicted dehydrogenase